MSENDRKAIDAVFAEAGKKPLTVGGVPLMLAPDERAKRLRRCGLGRGWSLLSKGEVIVIDRNFRDLVQGFNSLAETTLELYECLKLACVNKPGTDEPVGLSEERLQAALAMKMPRHVDIKVPPPPPDDGGKN
jgi:hypothetical protein